MTKYITNFSRQAIDHWSNYEAVREKIQNALDSDGDFSYEIGDDYITLTNKNIKVSNKMLMMGLSDKRLDPTKRGTFGTGSIMAMCVLTARDIGVEIQNNDVIWKPSFEHCDKFDEDVMVIEEYSAPYPNTNFTVTITGLSGDDINDIKQTCLLFQDRDIIASTKYGDILSNVDDQGEVYVGELFVQQTNGFKYSYNIKPQYLKLNQDRQSCSEWDLQDVTANLLMSTGDVDLIKEAINANKLDTARVGYRIDNLPNEVNDDYAQEFVEENEGTLVTSDYSEHQSNVDNSVPSVYIANSTKVKSIQESSIYQESIADIELVEKLSPTELLEEMKEQIMEILCKEVKSETSSEIEKLLDGTIAKSEEDNWY